MQRALDFLQAHNEVALATVCNNKPELRVFSLSAAKGQSVLRLRRMCNAGFLRITRSCRHLRSWYPCRILR